MDEVARLEIDGKVYELPIVTGSEGERALDIRNLRSESGLQCIRKKGPTNNSQL